MRKPTRLTHNDEDSIGYSLAKGYLTTVKHLADRLDEAFKEGRYPALVSTADRERIHGAVAERPVLCRRYAGGFPSITKAAISRIRMYAVNHARNLLTDALESGEVRPADIELLNYIRTARLQGVYDSKGTK